MGLWSKIKQVALTDVRVLARGMGKAELDSFERALFESDLGLAATTELVGAVTDEVRRGKLRRERHVVYAVKDISFRVERGELLGYLGPKGAGKSTVLHSIFGFTTINSGSILTKYGSDRTDVTRLSANEKLRSAGIAYILQDKSVFPNMTVEENLWMGAFLMERTAEAKLAAERIFDQYPRVAARRKHPAKVLSGGERRLLEISRALVMEPKVLLVDEPSIGLEPRFIDMVFEILGNLQHKEGKTIVMVEQNAKKGLEFANIGYVLV